MKITKGLIVMGVLAGLWAYASHGVGGTVKVLPRETGRHLVQLQDVDMISDIIHGTVVNNSPGPVKDVKLLVRHIWPGKDGTHPGAQSVSRSEVHTIETVIPPGGTQAFAHQTCLFDTTGEFFETRVSVAEFTELTAPAMAAVEVTSRGRTVVLDQALFDFPRSEISRNGKAILNRLASFLAESPTTEVTLSGYADPLIGSVRDFLVHRGVSEDEVIVHWFDKSNARAPIRPYRALGVQCSAVTSLPRMLRGLPQFTQTEGQHEG